MISKQIDLETLIQGLNYFQDRYESITIFADDLNTDTLKNYHSLLWEIFPDLGIIKLFRNPALSSITNIGSNRAAKNLVDATIYNAFNRAREIKGSNFKKDLLLALLNTVNKDNNRIFLLYFSFQENKWDYYDGSTVMIDFMKRNLIQH